MRLLHLVVIVVLVMAAARVYQIKFDATEQAEQVARVRAEIRRERDVIAALRAEWAQLDSPARIQELARRHLPLKPSETVQFEVLDNVPMRAPTLTLPDGNDPIGAMIDDVDDRLLTGSVAAPDPAR
jgi:cell division protein FtsL